MFNEGQGGDKKLQETMEEFRNLYRETLRASNSCLKGYMTKSEIQDSIITIQPKIKPSPFPVRQCEEVQIIVDNVRNRAQPMNI